MRARILIAAIAFLFPACAYCQANAGAAAADNLAVHRLLGQYAQAVDTVELKLLAEIWSHSRDVSFIYPFGEEHGFDAIERNVFEKGMGEMFSARDLKMHDVAIYVNGDSAWSEFHWDFHATLRKDASAVTTHGVETQVYRKENRQWRLVHVHYSEDRQPTP
ncbi:MAG TPA: nuclear transport factor 2 family protein [Bryobacteraceae bacterium]|jgi:ketosteroid isomerase-like protein